MLNSEELKIKVLNTNLLYQSKRKGWIEFPINLSNLRICLEKDSPCLNELTGVSHEAMSASR